MTTSVLFTNVRIIDGTGAQPFSGELLVQANRIAGVGRGPRSLPTAGVTVIDGAGATLMPGMVEAHTHFSWNDAANLSDLQRLPLEEHVLWSASVAKRYLEAGWTSCVGAACAKPRLDVVTRNAINQGSSRDRATWRPARRSRWWAGSATRRCRTCRFPSSAS